MGLMIILQSPSPLWTTGSSKSNSTALFHISYKYEKEGIHDYDWIANH